MGSRVCKQCSAAKFTTAFVDETGRLVDPHYDVGLELNLAQTLSTFAMDLIKIICAYAREPHFYRCVDLIQDL